MSRLIGLTGGIATGKSSVSQLIRMHGIPVLDADLIARQVVEPQTKGLEKLSAYFGESILQSNGTLNRQALAKRIFDNPLEREKLNQLLHPLIESEMDQQIDKLNASIIVLDIPLLFETDFIKKVDQTLVVYTPKYVQLKRLMKRDHIGEAEAMKRIMAQQDIEVKRNKADHVIDNSGTIKETEIQVIKWLKQL